MGEVLRPEAGCTRDQPVPPSGNARHIAAPHRRHPTRIFRSQDPPLHGCRKPKEGLGKKSFPAGRTGRRQSSLGTAMPLHERLANVLPVGGRLQTPVKSRGDRAPSHPHHRVRFDEPSLLQAAAFLVPFRKEADRQPYREIRSSPARQVCGRRGSERHLLRQQELPLPLHRRDLLDRRGCVRAVECAVWLSEGVGPFARRVRQVHRSHGPINRTTG